MESKNYLEFEFNRELKFNERFYINQLIEECELVKVNNRWYSKIPGKDKEFFRLFRFGATIELHKPKLCSAFSKLEVEWFGKKHYILDQWIKEGLI